MQSTRFIRKQENLLRQQIVDMTPQINFLHLFELSYRRKQQATKASERTPLCLTTQV